MSTNLFSTCFFHIRTFVCNQSSEDVPREELRLILGLIAHNYLTFLRSRDDAHHNRLLPKRVCASHLCNGASPNGVQGIISGISQGKDAQILFQNRSNLNSLKVVPQSNELKLKK